MRPYTPCVQREGDPGPPRRQARRARTRKGTVSWSRHGAGGHHSGRTHVTLQVVRSEVRPGSFPLFLVAALLLYVLNGLAVDLRAAAIIGRLVVAWACLYVLSASRITLWLGVLVVALMITFEARLWTLDPRVSRVLQDTMTIGLLLWVLLVVLREVFRPGTAEGNAVVGAPCGFLLILMVFMRVIASISFHFAGKFTDGTDHRLNRTPRTRAVPVPGVASLRAD